MKICHLSSLHSRYDTRVFVKHCSSLATAGYDVTYMVADGKGDEKKNGVTIVDIGVSTGLVDRLRRVNKRLIEQAITVDADYYIFHDPELCVQARKLTNEGKKVIYDAHEDSPRQYLSNFQGNRLKGKLIALAIEFLENSTAKKLYGIMTATEQISDRYRRYNNNVSTVKNYPIVAELQNDSNWDRREVAACYIGGLRNTRGISEIVKACHMAEMPLVLAGPWQPSAYADEMALQKGWANAQYLGYIGRREVKHLLANSRVGLLTLYKTANHVHSLPIKLFEYMIAGLPVVASDIPAWKEIIEKHKCGICVDPTKPEEIAAALQRLKNNPEDAKAMGERGRQAVLERYCWDTELEKVEGMLSTA